MKNKIVFSPGTLVIYVHNSNLWGMVVSSPLYGSDVGSRSYRVKVHWMPTGNVGSPEITSLREFK
jgi:hypothetical protein